VGDRKRGSGFPPLKLVNDARTDKPSFADAYDEHVWRVYGFLGYRLRSREDAEDLTQQTFERALKAWRQFDPARGSIGAWLISIARNLLIDHLRRDRSGDVRPLDDQPERLLGVETGPDDIGLEPELEEALVRLPDRAREVIALRFGGDLNGPEIAELMDLSLANVHQILSRSLRALRAELSRERAAATA
jgi:RNA polymerase sigma factor (sigma-70 family)